MATVKQLHKIEQLAVFGGKPKFPETLHVGKPNVPNRARLLERINTMLDNGWLTNNGPLVEELEQHICNALGVHHCVAMCNGTVALEIAVRALGLTGEVIVPAFTFVATAHCLQWQGIRPVFCDIDAETLCIDVQQIERLITARTTGIIGVHIWGHPCDVESLSAVAEKHGLALLFDAAHAFGCSHKQQMVGSFGRAEVFSLHATKCVHSFEGGAVVTNDGLLAERLRLMRNFGFRSLDEIVHIGINGKMSEACAAMGLTSLESMEKTIAVNRENYLNYKEHLSLIPGCRLLPYDEDERCNYHYAVIEVDEATTGLSRDNLVKVLHAENIRARRYFYPGCHRSEPYRSLYPEIVLPVTDRLCQRFVCLPTGYAVTPTALAEICDLIRFSLSRGLQITSRLSQ